MWNDGAAISVSNFGTTVIVRNESISIVYNKEDQELPLNIAAPDKYLSSASVDVSKDNYDLFIVEPQIDAFVSYNVKAPFKNWMFPYATKSMVYDGNTIAEEFVKFSTAIVGVYRAGKHNILQYLKGPWSEGASVPIYKVQQHAKYFGGFALSLKRPEAKPLMFSRYYEPINAMVSEQTVCIEDFSPANAFVEDWTVKKMATGLTIEPISVLVEDYKPPTWGQTGSGSGLKNVRFVVQKYAFAEILLNFTDCKATDILGLPQGLNFDKSAIKGSPMISGNFPIQIKLDNTRTLDALLIVPEVPRQI